jgi:hypothetical protein
MQDSSPVAVDIARDGAGVSQSVPPPSRRVLNGCPEGETSRSFRFLSILLTTIILPAI